MMFWSLLTYLKHKYMYLIAEKGKLKSINLNLHLWIFYSHSVGIFIETHDTVILPPGQDIYHKRKKCESYGDYNAHKRHRFQWLFVFRNLNIKKVQFIISKAVWYFDSPVSKNHRLSYFWVWSHQNCKICQMIALTNCSFGITFNHATSFICPFAESKSSFIKVYTK